MNNFKHSMTVAADPSAVYQALATIDGLRGWWTTDCEGAEQVGGIIHFRFGTTAKAMRIEQLAPGSEVRWRCTEAYIDAASIVHKDEWVGTEMLFGLSVAGDGQTRVDFEHIGLVPSLECYGICRKGWQHFLASLQHYAETGDGTPYASVCIGQTQTMERSAAA